MEEPIYHKNVQILSNASMHKFNFPTEKRNDHQFQMNDPSPHHHHHIHTLSLHTQKVLGDVIVICNRSKGIRGTHNARITVNHCYEFGMRQSLYTIDGDLPEAVIYERFPICTSQGSTYKKIQLNTVEFKGARPTVCYVNLVKGQCSLVNASTLSFSWGASLQWLQTYWR